MSKLELKIPPPVVAAFTAGAMWIAARWIGLSGLFAGVPPDWRIGAALFIALIGLGFDLTGVLGFIRAKTTVNPLKPERSAALVTGGIYRITRNPMYVGMALILLAWAIYLGSGTALVGPLAFALYITRFQIQPEERVLAGRFGSEFESYCARVRRWL
jgi:protein-S-isoprenylcysteine O-methyltransferase Ste14